MCMWLLHKDTVFVGQGSENHLSTITFVFYSNMEFKPLDTGH